MCIVADSDLSVGAGIKEKHIIWLDFIFVYQILIFPPELTIVGIKMQQ